MATISIAGGVYLVSRMIFGYLAAATIAIALWVVASAVWWLLPIERRFREVRRRTRPMGTFQDRTSMARILFAVFLHENRNQGLATPSP